ncbi:MAG: PAS domain-containing protein [Flavobacteriales bacterium]|nr:PAS domain-containing protein [Flavobacteriales bacterium]
MHSRIETRFETIFNHVNEGILIADSNGMIILANPKANQMFGYADGELEVNLSKYSCLLRT